MSHDLVMFGPSTSRFVTRKIAILKFCRAGIVVVSFSRNISSKLLLNDVAQRSFRSGIRRFAVIKTGECSYILCCLISQREGSTCPRNSPQKEEEFRTTEGCQG